MNQKETHGAKSWTTLFNYLGLTKRVTQEDISGDSQSTKKTYDYDASGLRIGMIDTPKDTTKPTETYTYGYDVHGSVSLLLKDTGDAKASYGYTAYGQIDDKVSSGDNVKQSDGDIEDALNPYRYSASASTAGPRPSTWERAASGPTSAASSRSTSTWVRSTTCRLTANTYSTSLADAARHDLLAS